MRKILLSMKIIYLSNYYSTGKDLLMENGNDKGNEEIDVKIRWNYPTNIIQVLYDCKAIKCYTCNHFFTLKY